MSYRFSPLHDKFCIDYNAKSKPMFSDTNQLHAKPSAALLYNNHNIWLLRDLSLDGKLCLCDDGNAAFVLTVEIASLSLSTSMDYVITASLSLLTSMDYVKHKQ